MDVTRNEKTLIEQYLTMHLYVLLK